MLLQIAMGKGMSQIMGRSLGRREITASTVIENTLVNPPHPRLAELSALLATPKGSIPAAQGLIGCGYEVQGDG